MIEALTDNIVSRQLTGLIANAEALLSMAAWADLPAGLRIIQATGSRLGGFCYGSGHHLAQAHGCRPGAVAVAVAAEDALRLALDRWPNELPVALAEAGVMIEHVAAHELAHALTADIDAELQPVAADILRSLANGSATLKADSLERSARGHGPAWAAALVVLSRRCRQHRPGARHRWHALLERDLRSYGIDAEYVAAAVGDVADERPLRDLLAADGVIVSRVSAAIPDEAERARLIAGRGNETTPADPGHVAPVAAGVAED